VTDSDDCSKEAAKESKGAHAGNRPPVLVVGAGPTGLLLAAELQRRGVPCHLIDARPGPLHWDRATVVHPRSLEVFESLGLVGRFLDAGTRQRAVKVHSGGQVLGTMDLSTCGSIYGFNLGVSEEVTESILTDYLHEQGGEVNRSSRLVGLKPHPECVLAEIERDGGRYQVEARYVLGCDGIYSPTRDLSGIGFEGHDIAKPWAVFDATLQGWVKQVRRHLRLSRHAPGHPDCASRPALARLFETELDGVGSRRRRRLDHSPLRTRCIFHRRGEPYTILLPH
jgi:2-polyprenyl-6-methoxyphenol hydroxylase-like FAD-dependent oxidoreductase